MSLTTFLVSAAYQLRCSLPESASLHQMRPRAATSTTTRGESGAGAVKEPWLVNCLGSTDIFLLHFTLRQHMLTILKELRKFYKSIKVRSHPDPPCCSKSGSKSICYGCHLPKTGGC
ncbi:uncharacterized protein K460DRAFT_115095 [Cucurbitaria berberidis CBS 394.84]|uniref:Uncharacterized protein n=1 Tax=Cucurbitaria berberidis CBS 394.84 TaxID=1168544 RepID=A0A9P4GGP6_9PLEO|nr:uncharacterized protein K460DRAFT_115095 [Cucurbitaria berberidis CBS 394.84]KAF1845778.1 hypothetical protein K460DRAFT_115095 [Cucurbitaria berberidis CBS 394.84]